MKDNTSPGSDGFTTEFYKFFWPDIQNVVFKSFQHSFKNEKLSIEQRRGILTLIPKLQKDVRYLSSWRPLSLLNTDYNILAKILVNRLHHIIDTLVSEDQNGSIKGRFIGQNIRTISDMIECMEHKKTPGMIALLDFEKAFDTVRWKFLHSTLIRMKFGPTFRKWIHILYTDITCCCMNNGHATFFFELTRGIRQRCPISGLLFILVAEILAIKIRSDEHVIGITINEVPFKISQLADDTTLFLANDNALKRILQILDMFHKCSGLKLNKSKTEIFYLGNTNHRPNETIHGVKIAKEWFKALGIYFCKDSNEMAKKNLEERYIRFKNIIRIWKTRDLSLKGKITILKSLAIPQLLYTTSVIYVPDAFIEKVDNDIVNFVWNNKPPKVKTSTMIADIEDGGLKMPRFSVMVQSQKILWIKRWLLQDEKTSSWTTLAKSLTHITTNLVKSKQSLAYLPKCQSIFYRQVLDTWYKLYSVPPSDINIPEELLWENKFILIGGKPAGKDYKKWQMHNIWKIKHIVNISGQFLTLTQMQNKYNVMINLMQYNSIVHAIPSKWKAILRAGKCKFKNEDDSGALILEDKTYAIESLTSKVISYILTKRIQELPTSLEKWFEQFPFLNDQDFSIYFRLPYKIIRDTKLQTFQYRLINRILPCKEYLFKIKLSESKFCVTCKMIENLEHMICLCKDTQLFWSQIWNWTRQTLDSHIIPSKTDILFGIDFTEDTLLLSINYIIIHAKYYLFRQKISDAGLFLLSFLTELKTHVNTELYCHRLSVNKMRTCKWDMLYAAL
jgi:hypothetical protein